MKIWTYGEIHDKVIQDWDLEDIGSQGFLSFDELVGYCNEGIDEAEAEIINLYEDYFLKQGTISLVEGQSDYAPPADIYANKIRGLIYTNGAEIYPIRRARALDLFHKLEEITQHSSHYPYEYILTNATAGLPRITIFPASRVSGDFVKIWYIRNANRVPLSSEGSESATRATSIDIPEFAQFIMFYMAVRAMQKEGHPLLEETTIRMEQLRGQMVSTLTNMIPDGEGDKVLMDLELYQEHN